MNKHGGYHGSDRETAADLSANINPLGPPSGVREMIIQSALDVSHYPEIDGRSAAESVERSLGLNEGTVIVGNGAIELIYLFARAIRPKRALVVQPAFNEYKRAFEMYGANVEGFECGESDGFAPNIDRLAEEVKNGSYDAVAICNPNNPTGVFTSSEKLVRLLEALKESGGTLLADESFIDYSGGGGLIGMVDEYPVLVIRSMTKFYSLAGLRIGYAVGSRQIIKRLGEFKEPWTVNALALKALPIIMEDAEYARQTMSHNDNEKRYMENELRKLKGIVPLKSSANFMLCRVEGTDVGELDRHLKSMGVYVRTCEDFEGLSGRYIRVAVKTREYTRRLVEAATKYFEYEDVAKHQESEKAGKGM